MPREVAADAGLCRARNLAALEARKIRGYLAPGRQPRRAQPRRPRRVKPTSRMANIAARLKRACRRARSVALGAAVGELAFSSGQDFTNHVLSEGDEGDQQVQQTTADALFADETPLAMKLDMEGYEAVALAGARVTLADPGLKALIV